MGADKLGLVPLKTRHVSSSTFHYLCIKKVNKMNAINGLPDATFTAERDWREQWTWAVISYIWQVPWTNWSWLPETFCLSVLLHICILYSQLSGNLNIIDPASYSNIMVLIFGCQKHVFGQHKLMCTTCFNVTLETLLIWWSDNVDKTFEHRNQGRQDIIRTPIN